MHRASKLHYIRYTHDLVYSNPILVYSYFKDGLKTIAHFGTYVNDLSAKLQSIKTKQDEERKKLLELRTLLRSTPDFDRVEVIHRTLIWPLQCV